MKKWWILIPIAALLAMAAPAAAGPPPRQIAGIVLGGKVAEFGDLLNMNTVLPVRYCESLKEVETWDMPGFKNGLIAYSSCVDQGTILRIKLKYDDESQKFFDELLKRFKKQWGEPDEWRGDPFRVLQAWKWSFSNEKGDSISMILQHNTRDEEEKMGNSLKLTNTTQLEKEMDCFRGTGDPSRQGGGGRGRGKGPGTVGWDQLVPR